MHLLPKREEGHPYAGGDEEYRGDEAEPVGDRVGDNRGANECDDHVDGHETAGLPSWAERGGLTAAGSRRCVAGVTGLEQGPGRAQPTDASFSAPGDTRFEYVTDAHIRRGELARIERRWTWQSLW